MFGYYQSLIGSKFFKDKFSFYLKFVDLFANFRNFSNACMRAGFFLNLAFGEKGVLMIFYFFSEGGETGFK